MCAYGSGLWPVTRAPLNPMSRSSWSGMEPPAHIFMKCEEMGSVYVNSKALHDLLCLVYELCGRGSALGILERSSDISRCASQLEVYRPSRAVAQGGVDSTGTRDREMLGYLRRVVGTFMADRYPDLSDLVAKIISNIDQRCALYDYGEPSDPHWQIEADEYVRPEGINIALEVLIQIMFGVYGTFAVLMAKPGIGGPKTGMMGEQTGPSKRLDRYGVRCKVDYDFAMKTQQEQVLNEEVRKDIGNVLKSKKAGIQKLKIISELCILQALTRVQAQHITIRHASYTRSENSKTPILIAAVEKTYGKRTDAGFPLEMWDRKAEIRSRLEKVGSGVPNRTAIGSERCRRIRQSIETSRLGTEAIVFYYILGRKVYYKEGEGCSFYIGDFVRRRDMYEKLARDVGKLQQIKRHKRGAIAEEFGFFGFLAWIYTIAVVFLPVAVLLDDPWERKNILVTLNDALQFAALLSSMGFFLFRTFCEDPYALKHALLGRTVLRDMEDVCNYLGVKRQRLKCIISCCPQMLDWVSEQDCCYSIAELTGDLRIGGGIRSCDMDDFLIIGAREAIEPLEGKTYRVRWSDRIHLEKTQMLRNDCVVEVMRDENAIIAG